MATFIDSNEYPSYAKAYIFEGQEWWLENRQFPRLNRMVCYMQNLDGIQTVLVFPY